MKQLLLMFTMFTLGTAGAFVHPFWGLLLYYTLAVLRPQYLWKWALPEWRWSLAAAGVVLLGCFLHLPKIVLRGRINLVSGLMIAYALLLLMSCLTAHDPALAQTWLIEFGKIVLMSLLLGLIADRLWHLRAMALMIFCTLGYAAYEINFHYLVEGRLDIYHYGYGGLDNNGAGLLLAMGVPFAYAVAVASPRSWQRWAGWGVALLMVHAVLMSYSRGAMLATGLGAVLLLMRHRRRGQAAVIGVAVVVAVALLAGPEIRDRFLSTTRFAQDNSAQSRFDSWSAAWRIAWEHPFVGQGIRNSNLFSHNYGADLEGRTIHSQYLQIAADSGIPAMVTYVVLLGAAIRAWGVARRRCVETDNAQARAIEPVLLAMQTSLVIFAFGGAFLSLEVFELPWLLTALAGVAPGVVERWLDERSESAEQRADTPPPVMNGLKGVPA